MNLFLVIAAALSLVTLAVHLFAGGPTIARPLLQARDLTPVPKYTNYYCWHIVSIVLLAMPTGFLMGAFDPASRQIAMLMTALASAFAVWSLALVMWKRQKPLELPQWAFFLPISVAGVVGLWP